jgi:hypothetical protein
MRVKTLLIVLGLSVGILGSLTDCSSDVSPVNTAGHWGDRTTYKENNPWIQNYYSNADGRLIGWLNHYYNNPNIEARCVNGTTRNEYEIDLGDFESQEDGQVAIEKYCLYERQ